MDRERDSGLLSDRENSIMRGIGMGTARDCKRRHERAFATIFDCAFELACGRLRIAQRQMCDRNQPPA